MEQNISNNNGNINALTLREHQLVMLKLLTAFDKFCDEHNLHYQITFGTLIGAIRHGGFIPWDDDADIVMPRPDYEKLLAFTDINDNIEIVSRYNNHGYYHPFAYANIVDKDTIMVEENIRKPTGKGVFIDVFPVDGMSDDPKKRNLQMKKAKILQLLFACTVNKPRNNRFVHKFIHNVLYFLGRFIGAHRLGNMIDKNARTYEYQTSNYVGCPSFWFRNPERFCFPKYVYDDEISVLFEGYNLKCSKYYDMVLTKTYGEYMKLPPEDQRFGRHKIEIYKR